MGPVNLAVEEDPPHQDEDRADDPEQELALQEPLPLVVDRGDQDAVKPPRGHRGNNGRKVLARDRVVQNRSKAVKRRRQEQDHDAGVGALQERRLVPPLHPLQGADWDGLQPEANGNYEQGDPHVVADDLDQQLVRVDFSVDHPRGNAVGEPSSRGVKVLEDKTEQLIQDGAAVDAELRQQRLGLWVVPQGSLDNDRRRRHDKQKHPNNHDDVPAVLVVGVPLQRDARNHHKSVGNAARRPNDPARLLRGRLRDRPRDANDDERPDKRDQDPFGAPAPVSLPAGPHFDVLHVFRGVVAAAFDAPLQNPVVLGVAAVANKRSLRSGRVRRRRGRRHCRRSQS